MEKRLKEITKEIQKCDEKLSEWHHKKNQLEVERTCLLIAPFKNGDYVVAEVPCGRCKKWEVCKIEIEEENGFLYVRPVKANGDLSGRRFYIHLTRFSNIHDYFKEVEQNDQ